MEAVGSVWITIKYKHILQINELIIYAIMILETMYDSKKGCKSFNCTFYKEVLNA